MPPIRVLATLALALVGLPGCGLRYAAGVRITPGDDHPVRPELLVGAHPASWIAGASHRSFDAGGGLATDFSDIGVYAEGTGVVDQKRGIPTLAMKKGETATMLDRTSVGGQVRWMANDGARPAVEALVSNELSGFSRNMDHTGGIWGEVAIGAYLGVTYGAKGKWTLSTGVQARTPFLLTDGR